MEASTTSRGRLRRLAEIRPGKGRVLSLYFDLDPAEFATAPARASQITSVLDEAAKLIDGRDDLDHEEKVGLREDVERVRGLFDPQGMGAGGTRGIAVFACGPCDILEVIRTAHPVESREVINHTPHIEPLAAAGDRERWCVVLVNRREGRILFGDQDGLQEFENVHDDTLNQQQQGGWSQRRYEESQEGEKRDHLDHVGSRLLELVRSKPFDRLLIGGPEPIDTEFEQRLHPYVKERLVEGRVKVDVEVASAADVLAAATPVFEEYRREKERQAIERLRAGLGRGPDGLAVP